jgi:hypothetical protein
VAQHHPEIVNTPVFMAVFNELLNSDSPETIKALPLYEMFTYRLWNNENYSFEIREKTSFYRIVSNWIVNFELKSGNLEQLSSQFELIKNFMVKETHTALERVVMIEETFEDLKELIGEEFWVEGERLEGARVRGKEQSEIKEAACSEETLSTIYKIFEVLETIITPLFTRLGPALYCNTTYPSLPFPNTSLFTRQCILFILRQQSIPTYIQTELTKCALIHLQSVAIQPDSTEPVITMIQHLMVRTNKAVRFALVVEYVEFYEFLEMMGCEDIIEELENLIYFRELIIGKKIVEENLEAIGNSLNELNLSYHELYVKAGTTKRIYFSNDSPDTVLKFDLLLS